MLTNPRRFGGVVDRASDDPADFSGWGLSIGLPRLRNGRVGIPIHCHCSNAGISLF